MTDVVWCDLRGVKVQVAECFSGCPAPEHRVVCIMEGLLADEARQLDEIAALYRDEPLEGGGA